MAILHPSSASSTFGATEIRSSWLDQLEEEGRVLVPLTVAFPMLLPYVARQDKATHSLSRSEMSSTQPVFFPRSPSLIVLARGHLLLNSSTRTRELWHGIRRWKEVYSPATTRRLMPYEVDRIMGTLC